MEIYGKSIDMTELILGYIKAHRIFGCSLKDIFSEIQVVHGNTLLSYDTVCRWKKKFKFVSGVYTCGCKELYTKYQRNFFFSPF